MGNRTGIRKDWLTRLDWLPRLTGARYARAASVTLLAVAAAVQAITQAVTLGGAGATGYQTAEYALPLNLLALTGAGRAAVLLASVVPAAGGIGIAAWAGRLARTGTEAGEALADTLLAHTARGERARIARELHDVVAHHISMIAVLSETGATDGADAVRACRRLRPGKRCWPRQ